MRLPALMSVGAFCHRHLQVIGAAALLAVYWQFWRSGNVWPFPLILTAMMALALWPYTPEQKEWKGKSKAKAAVIFGGCALGLVIQACVSHMR